MIPRTSQCLWHCEAPGCSGIGVNRYKWCSTWLQSRIPFSGWAGGTFFWVPTLVCRFSLIIFFFDSKRNGFVSHIPCIEQKLKWAAHPGVCRFQMLSEMVFAHIFLVLNENKNEQRTLVQIDQLHCSRNGLWWVCQDNFGDQLPAATSAVCQTLLPTEAKVTFGAGINRMKFNPKYWWL